jgi:hypothetical protein
MGHSVRSVAQALRAIRRRIGRELRSLASRHRRGAPFRAAKDLAAPFLLQMALARLEAFLPPMIRVVCESLRILAGLLRGGEDQSTKAFQRLVQAGLNRPEVCAYLPDYIGRHPTLRARLVQLIGALIQILRKAELALSAPQPARA